MNCIKRILFIAVLLILSKAIVGQYPIVQEKLQVQAEEYRNTVVSVKTVIPGN